jgi:hypothetical protein
MKKKLAVPICLGLSAITGMSAGRSAALHAPVCRFIDFYIAAERSEMTGLERILYSLASAAKKPEATTCPSRL